MYLLYTYATILKRCEHESPTTTQGITFQKLHKVLITFLLVTYITS